MTTLQTKIIFLIIIGLCASAEFLYKEDKSCKKIFDFCESDAECCPRLNCMSGRCDNGCLTGDDCHKMDESCTLTKDCCMGLLCLDGKCDHRCTEFGFKVLGETCKADVECCNGYTCRNGTCIDRVNDDQCKKMGEPCTKSHDCCIADKLLCLNGVCDHRCAVKTFE